jgi:hypothetical protein
MADKSAQNSSPLGPEPAGVYLSVLKLNYTPILIFIMKYSKQGEENQFDAYSELPKSLFHRFLRVTSNASMKKAKQFILQSMFRFP